MPPPVNLDALLQQLQFPGMEARESDLFKLFLERHGAEFDAFAFNVRLGDGAEPLETLNDATRRQARLLTQKRADAIATLGELDTIIEVKWRCGLGAVGQLTGYRDLYMRDRPQAPAPRLLVVAALADQDVRFVLANNGIDLVLYERA